MNFPGARKYGDKAGEEDVNEKYDVVVDDPDVHSLPLIENNIYEDVKE